MRQQRRADPSDWCWRATYSIAWTQLRWASRRLAAIVIWLDADGIEIPYAYSDVIVHHATPTMAPPESAGASGSKAT